MRKFNALFVFAFGLFFGLSAFAQTEVYDEASFWAVRNNLSEDYIQTADITLTDASKSIYQIGSTAVQDGVAFSGTYDGGGHAIRVAFSDGTNRNKALFGVNEGTIKNLSLENINVVATGDAIKQVAVLCWDNKGNIENIKATGCSVSNDYASSERGGAIITALNVGNVYNCHATGCTVNVYGNAGGIVGRMGYYGDTQDIDGSISYCSFQGSVTSRRVAANCTGNASGIVGEIVSGTVKGCLVENGTTVTREGTFNAGGNNYVRDVAGIGVASHQIPDGGNVSVGNCYSAAELSTGFGGESHPISTDGYHHDSYTSADGSPEYLLNQLNAGLEPPAFEIGPDGQITYIDQTEFASELTTTQDGDFLSPETWGGNKRFSNATATRITINHKVNLTRDVVIPSNIVVAFGEQGSFTINNEGSFVTCGQEIKNLTIERAINAEKWNFIGLANSTNVDPLAAEGLPNLWALPFDYSQNAWSTEYLHTGDALERGNGIFVSSGYSSGAVVASQSALHTDVDVAVTKTIQGSANGNGYWMALANPYMGMLDVAKFLGDNTSVQGECVYTYNGTTFFDYYPSVSVGQGFFVNMGSTGEKTINFKPSQMMGYPSTGAKTVAREREYVMVSVSTDGYKVPVRICRNELASQEYDIFDANKMFGDGSVAEPYFVTEGINLCKEEIKSMPYYATMNIKSGEARTVEIVADAIPEGYSATLIDGDEEIELTEGMVYTTDIASGENAERFKLLIGEKNVSLEDAEAVENLIQVSNIGRRVNISADGAIDVEVYNALGQKVYSTTNNSFALDGVSAGAYVIKVSNGKSVKSEKIILQ